MTKLCIVDRGAIFVNRDQYISKNSTVNYLNSLSDYYEITFISGFTTQKHFFHNRVIDSKKMSVIAMSKSFLSKYQMLKHHILKTDFLLIFMPTYSGILASIIAQYNNIPYAVYHGNDWISSIHNLYKGKSSLKKLLLSIQTRIAIVSDRVLNRRACFILTTGGQIYSKYSNLGLNAIETKPIIDLDVAYYADYKFVDLNSPVELLFVGSTIKRKGLNALILALKLLKNRVKCKLTIVGEGSQFDELNHLVCNLNLKDAISFPGYISEIDSLAKYYRQADLFILPSYAEGFPRVIYEAAMFGLPLLVTPVNSVPYLMDDRVNALFIEPGNAEDIADKIDLICKDDALRAKIAKNANMMVKNILVEPAWQQHSRLIHACLNIDTNSSSV